jgi:hypothetical protein
MTLLTDPNFLAMLLVGGIILGLALFFAPLGIWAATARTARVAREQVALSKQIVQLLERAQGIQPESYMARADRRDQKNKEDRDVLAKARAGIK